MQPRAQRRPAVRVLTRNAGRIRSLRKARRRCPKVCRGLSWSGSWTPSTRRRTATCRCLQPLRRQRPLPPRHIHRGPVHAPAPLPAVRSVPRACPLATTAAKWLGNNVSAATPDAQAAVARDCTKSGSTADVINGVDSTRPKFASTSALRPAPSGPRSEPHRSPAPSWSPLRCEGRRPVRHADSTAMTSTAPSYGADWAPLRRRCGEHLHHGGRAEFYWSLSVCRRLSPAMASVAARRELSF